MSDAVAVAVILSVVIVLVAAATLWTWERVAHLQAGPPGPPGPEGPPGPPGPMGMTGDPGRPVEGWERVAEEPQDEVLTPIPVHPEHPPVWRVYQPKYGAPPRFCDCHHEALMPNQPVLWWTRPDDSVLLFCELAFPREEAPV